MNATATAIAGALLCLVALLVSAPPAHAATTPSLRLSAPTAVGPGQRFAVTATLADGGPVAGYQLTLRYAPGSLRMAGAWQRPALGDAPLIVAAPATRSGRTLLSGSCAGPACANAKTGRVSLTKVELYPRRASVRIAVDAVFVDAQGRRVAVAMPTRVLHVKVGTDTTFAAPSAAVPAAAPPTSAPRSRDVTRDGRVDAADSAAVAAAWTDAHTNDTACDVLPAVDVNRDGCLDVIDAQLVAAAQRASGTTTSLSSARTADAASLAAPQPTPAPGVTFTVNAEDDRADSKGDGVCRTSAGTCTLRAALTEANRASARARIAFSIGGGGVRTIRVGGSLPQLTNPAGIEIDGYTQPGSQVNTDDLAAGATIAVNVDGPGYASGTEAFFMSTPNNVIRGLAIYDFALIVRMYGSKAVNNVIAGSFICTNAAGTFGAATHVGSQGVVIQAGAHDNFVGLPGNASRTVISGCPQNGVAMYDHPTARNVITNSIVGLTPSGQGRLPNRGHGIDVNSWVTDTMIGGDDASERNVVSGNVNTGIEISHGSGTLRNSVIGNFVGTGLNGNTAPDYAVNGQVGVRLEGAASCTSCPDDAGFSVVASNVIVRAPVGGLFIDKGQHDNVVKDNRIGITRNGTAAGNKQTGVRIEHGARRNVIGPGNIIAFNDNGIQIQAVGTQPADSSTPATERNTVTRNSIFDNVGMGIDLAPIGKPNSSTGGDPQTNNGIAFPSLRTPTSGAVAVTTCSGCRVEVFVTDGSQPIGGNGEGMTFEAAVTAGSSGAVTVPLSSAAAGKLITATATDAAGNTSEFSRNVAVPGTPTNSKPVAAFTFACTELACAFDASGSQDPDGNVAAYSWQFGDGSHGAGRLPDHTYAAAGTYTVTLTVTDNDGATDPVSRQVTAAAAPPPSTAVASDTFTRTVTGGWGTAETGGPWTLTGPAGDFNVSGDGRIVTPAPGQGRSVHLGNVAETDVDARATVSLDTLSGGSGTYVNLQARRQSSTLMYTARVRISGAGEVRVAATRFASSSTEQVMGSEVLLAGSYQKGTRLNLRARVVGVSPARIQVKAWLSTASQPSAWTVDVTDSTSGLQQAGALGLRTYVSGSAANVPVTAAFDDLDVTEVGS